MREPERLNLLLGLSVFMLRSGACIGLSRNTSLFFNKNYS